MAEILIKNMEMPKSCKDCTRMGISHCPMKEEPIIIDGCEKPLNCPLVEVPPHGRLIDADILRMKYEYGENRKKVDNAPTVLEANT